MIAFPHAKINLGLYVVNKRSDGFHNILTCFYPLLWTDVLEILPSQKLHFSYSGLTIPGETDNNLCLKAYRLLQEKYDLPSAIIHLHKAIPMGAGLGGGSSDAAFTIKMLNELFNLSLSTLEMMHYAAQVGSDCPFFIQDYPVIATGTGNEFKDIKLSLKHYHIVVVNPKIHIGTAEAYRSLSPREPNINVNDLLNSPIAQWKGQLDNDFEGSVFKKFPEVKSVKDALYKLGAEYASMSGSGSSVYGLFKQKVENLNGYFPEHYTVWQGKG